MEKLIGNYFLQEKNAENNNNLIYSSFNYYYTDEKEKEVKKDGLLNKKYRFKINTD